MTSEFRCQFIDAKNLGTRCKGRCKVFYLSFFMFILRILNKIKNWHKNKFVASFFHDFEKGVQKKFQFGVRKNGRSF